MRERRCAMSNSEHIARIKRAELLSSIGAGVLGGGIALLLAKFLAPYAIPILLLGLISHAIGMSRKHGLEQQSQSVASGGRRLCTGSAGWRWLLYCSSSSSASFDDAILRAVTNCGFEDRQN